MTDTSPTKSSVQAGPDPTELALPRLNILVVDDDQYINRLVQIRLKNTGYATRSASDGAEALAQIRLDQPDLIFLDVSMPEVDGLDVLKTIRQEGRDIAVIMMTAFGSESIAVEALRLGADDYLRKPFEPAEFEAVFSRTAKRLTLARQNAVLQARLAAELARAAQVQQDLLPQDKPQLPGYRFAAHFQAARAVSGDFYDWYVDQGHAVLTLGDVMGKGMPAALLMATVRATMRAAGRAQSPGDALALTATAIGQDLERSESFVTLFHARLNPENHCLTYANAGHGMGFVLRRNGDALPIATHNLPLGIMEQTEFTEVHVQLEPGDSLFVFSDGLLDAPGRLDAGRLAEIVHPAVDIQDTVDRLVHRALNGARELPDDLTIIAVAYTP